MNLAFLGLGNMGFHIARNLLRAGHQVTVYNRTQAKANPLAAEGAKVADSPADAARNAEIAFSMLADDPAVERIVFDPHGLVEGLPQGALHVSCSTISTSLARDLAGEHAKHGQHYLSAPVFGRPEAAEGKKLIVVAAGGAEDLERCHPLFEAIGRATYIAGAEPWQANAVKLCGNFMIASMMEAFGEAFATLRKAHVDPHLFLDVMNTLFGSPIYANYGRMIADQQFEPAGFALKLGSKDIRLGLQAAEECASPMPLASLIRDQFLDAMAHGQAEQDWSSVTRVAARNAGL